MTTIAREPAKPLALIAAAMFFAVVVIACRATGWGQSDDTSCVITDLAFAVQSGSSEIQSITPSADQASLSKALDDMTALQERLLHCVPGMSLSDRDAAYVAAYGAATARVALLQRLGRQGDAQALASDSLTSLNSLFASVSPPIAAPQSAKLDSDISWFRKQTPPNVAAAPTSTPIVPLTPLQQCEQGVTNLAGAVTASQCVAKLGQVQNADIYLGQYLHSGPASKSHDDARALAYDELAILENQRGEKDAAITHIKAAYAVDASTASVRVQIKTDMKMISLQTYRQVIAAEEAAIRRADAQALADAQAEIDRDTAGMSADQRKVYLDEGGRPDHVESFDSAMGHTEVWWYGDPTYRVGYTFENGVLTSVYRP
jgi:hypothetical protein